MQLASDSTVPVRGDSCVEISVVVPVYRCLECLRALYERLTAELRIFDGSYELVFVDDRSPDGSWRTLRELAVHDGHVKAVRLSRNFGQHAAITAGLSETTGRWVVVMDCDLQDRPEEIPRLYAKACEGFDIVFARRVGRRHPWMRRAASATYFRVLNALLGTDLSSEFGNFSIISARVRDEFLGFKDKDRHFLMILHWLGFEHTEIDIRHDERFAGESAYSFSMLVRFAIDGLFFQTTTLLRWIVYAGFGVSILGAVLAVLLVIRYFVGHTYPGWTSLGVIILVLSGFIISSTGVTGLYIGKIFNQVKDRPLYVIDTVVEPGAADVKFETRNEGVRQPAQSESHRLVNALCRHVGHLRHDPRPVRRESRDGILRERGGDSLPAHLGCREDEIDERFAFHDPGADEASNGAFRHNDHALTEAASHPDPVHLGDLARVEPLVAPEPARRGEPF